MEPRTVCEYCKFTKKIKKSTDVQKGTHLVFKRGMDCCPLYTHHAIVTAVTYPAPDRDSVIGETGVSCNLDDTVTANVTMVNGQTDVSCNLDDTANVTMVEFAKQKNKFRVVTSDKKLNFKEQTIWMTKHDTPYSGDEIAERAKRMQREYTNDKKKYNLFKRNCEHFVNHCVIGSPVSLQVKRLQRHIMSSISLITMILRIVFLISGLLFDLEILWVKMVYVAMNVSATVLYLTVMRCRLRYNNIRQQSHKLCDDCGSENAAAIRAERPMFVFFLFFDVVLSIMPFSRLNSLILLPLFWCFTGCLLYYIKFRISHSKSRQRWIRLRHI